MFQTHSILVAVFLTISLTFSIKGQEATHVWSDVSGNYRLQAEFVARNDTSVVLQLNDRSMLIVEIEQLSKTDQQYLADLESHREKAFAEESSTNERRGETTGNDSTNDESENNDLESQTKCWRLADINIVCGEVVEYGRRLVQIKRRGSRVYVNDRLFENMPSFYQQVAIATVNHFEKLGSESIENEDQLRRWLSTQPKRQKAFTVEGVIIENTRGDLFGVPFFMFDESDVDFFRSGWEAWEAADTDAKYQAEMSLRLRVETLMRQRKERAEYDMRRLHLFLEGYDAGMVDLWQVNLIPPGNSNGFPLRIVVPGRNSQQAQAEAQRLYPNMSVGATTIVRRRR